MRTHLPEFKMPNPIIFAESNPFLHKALSSTARHSIRDLNKMAMYLHNPLMGPRPPVDKIQKPSDPINKVMKFGGRRKMLVKPTH